VASLGNRALAKLRGCVGDPHDLSIDKEALGQ
jgi:hypothetical protein